MVERKLRFAPSGSRYSDSVPRHVPQERVQSLWSLARTTRTMVRITRDIGVSRVHVDESKVAELCREPRKMPPRTPDGAKAATVWKKTQSSKQQEERSDVLAFPNRAWIINPDGKFYLIWAGMMLPCMAYVSLVTPFETAFITADCALFWPNLFVDIYFVLDMICNFNIATFDWQSARWVTARRVIARQYLRGWFTIDFVSVVPLDAIVASRGHPIRFATTLTTCGVQSGGSELQLFSMLKLFRLLKLLRVLRIGRLVMRFASSVNISFKTQTLIKFGVLILFVTHLFACLIRVLGDTPGCRSKYKRNEETKPNENQATCWLASIRFYRKGIWFQYVASLDWAIKAMIGGSNTLTFGEMILGFVIMISGLVLTSYLVGEIANVLGNFDPALKDFRSTMDNLNQYLHDQKIDYALQIQLREYFINSENLFRKAYHRSMLENLSPQLRRSVAQAELGNWVLSLPFINDALRACGGLEPGADILYVPLNKFESGNWTESDLVAAQIIRINQSLTYSVQYYRVHAVHFKQLASPKGSFVAVADTFSRAHFDKFDVQLHADDEVEASTPTGTSPSTAAVTPKKSFKMLQRELQRNPHLMNIELVQEDGASHGQIFMPEFSLLRGRLADANREWRHLVAEFSNDQRPFVVEA